MNKNDGTKKRSPGRPREFDMDIALDRAAEVFWSKGYAATSIGDLTAALGISPPSLYNAFGDKEQLFIKCVERYALTVSEGIRASLHAPIIESAIEDFLVSAAKAFASENAPSGCLLIFGLGGASEDVPLAKAMLAASIELMVHSVERRLDLAKRDGQLPKNFPSRERAVLTADFLLAIGVKARGGAGLRQLQTEARSRTSLVLA